jgi:hypothetical protein
MWIVDCDLKGARAVSPGCRKDHSIVHIMIATQAIVIWLDIVLSDQNLGKRMRVLHDPYYSRSSSEHLLYNMSLPPALEMLLTAYGPLSAIFSCPRKIYLACRISPDYVTNAAPFWTLD